MEDEDEYEFTLVIAMFGILIAVALPACQPGKTIEGGMLTVLGLLCILATRMGCAAAIGRHSALAWMVCAVAGSPIAYLEGWHILNESRLVWKVAHATLLTAQVAILLWPLFLLFKRKMHP